MEYQTEKTDSGKYKITISLSKGDIDKIYNQKYKEVSKNIHINGFRPGKIPLEKVRSMVWGDPHFHQEVVSRIVQVFATQAMDEIGERFIGEPSVSLPEGGLTSGEESSQGGPMSFMMEVWAWPKVIIHQDQGFVLVRQAPQVSEEDVDGEVHRILERMRKFIDEAKMRETKEEGAEAKETEGDSREESSEAVVSREGVEEGAVVEVKGVDEGVVAGEKRNEEKNPGDSSLTLKEKELLTAIYGAESLEELREQIHKDFLFKAERSSHEDLEKKVEEILLEKNPIPLSSEFFDQVKAWHFNYIREQWEEEGLSEEAMDQKLKEVQKDFDDLEFQKSLKIRELMIPAIAEKNGIFVGPEEVERERESIVDLLIRRENLSRKQAWERINTIPSLSPQQLEKGLLLNRVIQFILKNSEIQVLQ